MIETSGKRFITYAVAALSLLGATLSPAANKAQAAGSRYFPETGKTVNDPFLAYWTEHGGLAQQGYPLTDAQNEKNDADGKTYQTQYFERARFEYHPEQSDPKFQVLLGLLGKEALAMKYGTTTADTDKAVVPGSGSKTFPETGKTVSGLFLQYWNQHGGLEQQGYPITEAFDEVNDADGESYITQYFERARFEYHPENADPKFKVLLGLVGKEIYDFKQTYGSTGGTGGTGGTSGPGGGGTADPDPATPENTLSVPGWTHMIVTTNNIALFYNVDKGGAASARVNSDGTLTVLQKFPYPPAAGGPEFSPGITIMSPGPADQVLFYRGASGAASVCFMSNDGIPGRCKAFNSRPGWSTISVDTVTGISYYNSQSDGIFNIGRLNPDGTTTNFSSNNSSLKAERLILPVGNDRWISYARLADGKYYGGTFSINPASGMENGFTEYRDLERSWSLIASNRNTLLLYDKGTRMSSMASVANNGSIVQLKSYAAPGTVTQLAAAPDGPFLSYSESSGLLTVTRVDSDGTATNLQQYSPKN